MGNILKYIVAVCWSDNISCHCSTILDSPVTEQEFLEQLHELNNKINFAKELSFRETLACSDIQEIVDRLKLKVRLRVRVFHTHIDNLLVQFVKFRQYFILKSFN